MAKLNKETTTWLPVNYTTNKKLAAAYKVARELQAKANEAMRLAEAIKTAELVAANEIPDGTEPFYSHRFGQWTVAADKVDQSILSQRSKASGGAKRTV